MVKDELVNKLDFEDRIEYKIDVSRIANRYNSSGINNYIFICAAFILCCLAGIIFIGILIGIPIYILSQFIDKKRYNKQLKEINNKYFEIKTKVKDKKKK